MSDEGESGDVAEATSISSRARATLPTSASTLAWLCTAANVMVVGLVIAKFGDDGANSASISRSGILRAVGAAGVVNSTLT